jgi:hypothetical protein
MAEADTAAAPAKVLPPKGSRMFGGYPSYIQSAKYVLAGGTDLLTDSTLYDGILSSSDGNAATVEVFSLPPGAIIHDVGWRVARAFGNAVTFTIGDSADAAGFAEAANVAATVGDSDAIATCKQAVINAWAGDSNPPGDTATTPEYAITLPRLHWNASAVDAYKSIDVTLGGAAVGGGTDGVLEVYVWYDLGALQSGYITT